MKRVIIFFVFLFLINSVYAYEVEYIHQDYLGNNIAITNEQGEVIWKADYEPFGKSFNELNENNNYKYNNKELDASTGLLYYGARYYDAELGRFTTADTIKGNIRQPQTLNKYVYTLNNPLKYIDPSGNQGIPALPSDYKGPFEFTKEEAGNLYVNAMTNGRINQINTREASKGIYIINFYHKLNKFNYANPDIFVLTNLDIGKAFSDDSEFSRRIEVFQSLVSEKVTVGIGMDDVPIKRSDLSIGAENKEVALTLLHEAFEAEYVSKESLQALKSYLNAEARISSLERQLKLPMWLDKRKLLKFEIATLEGQLSVYKSFTNRNMKVLLNLKKKD